MTFSRSNGGVRALAAGVAGLVLAGVAASSAVGAKPSEAPTEQSLADAATVLPESKASSPYAAQMLAMESGQPVEDLSQRTPTVAVVAL